MDYTVRLHYRVQEKLKSLCGGSTPGRVTKRARILLNLNEGYSVDEVAERVVCGTATVKRVRKRFLTEGWREAVGDKPRPGRPRTLADRQERELIALACTDPPPGQRRWTVRLLAKHYDRDVSRNTVHRVLQRDGLKPWREKNVVRTND